MHACAQTNGCFPVTRISPGPKTHHPAPAESASQSAPSRGRHPGSTRASDAPYTADPPTAIPVSPAQVPHGNPDHPGRAASNARNARRGRPSTRHNDISPKRTLPIWQLLPPTTA